MNKKNVKIKIIISVFLFFIFLPLFSSSAANFNPLKPDVNKKIGDNTWTLGGTAGYANAGDDDALRLVQTVINIFLSVIGVLLIIYVLYAGYNWLTARGDEEKVEKAKDTLKRAVIGVIIIVAAYAISVFVIGKIEEGTLSGGGNGSQQGGMRTTPPLPE